MNRTRNFLIGLLAVVILITGGIYLKSQISLRLLPSTNLSGLSIGGLQIGQSVSRLDLNMLTKNPNFKDRTTASASYRYFSDFMLVHDKKGAIVKLQTLSEEGLKSFAGGHAATLQEATDLFGSDYIDKSYDSAQELYSRNYYDKENGLQAVFVFPKQYLQDKRNSEDGIVWVILKKM